MKKERMLCGLMLVMIVNWLVHGELWAAIYFSAVMTGLLVYYRSVVLVRVLETALVRFVMILVVCLCFFKELNLMEAASWLMVCTASSALTQRIQKSKFTFLNHLSMFNMALMPVVLIVVLHCMQGSALGICVLMIMIALFQPSGLPVVSPLDSMDYVRTSAMK